MVQKVAELTIKTCPIRLQINQHMASMRFMREDHFPFTFPVKIESERDMTALRENLQRISDLIIDNRLVDTVAFDEPPAGTDLSDGYNVALTVSLLAEDAKMTDGQMERVLRALYAKVNDQEQYTHQLQAQVNTKGDFA